MSSSPQPKTGLPRVTAEFQEKLIQEVNTRSPLWDPTDAAFQNGAAIEQLWYEVAEAMGVPGKLTYFQQLYICVLVDEHESGCQEMCCV